MATAVDASEAALRTFTWKEVAEHNTPSSAWVSIHGYVYDVTEWIDLHPGGADVLLISAGRDVTQVYDSYHKASTAKAYLGKYLIGRLADTELVSFPEPSAFQVAVRKNVADYFAKNKIDPKFAPWMWARYLFIWGGIFASWYLQLQFGATHLIPSIACALFLGWCCALLGLMPLHDGSHFANTHQPWVWRAIGATHDFLNGSSYLVWLYQHMLGHHPYTNIEGVDPDIETAEDKDFRRIKSSQKWYRRYLSQQVYVPILYGLLALKTRIQDVIILHVLKTDGVIRINPPTTYHLAVFWLGKIFFVAYRIVIPCFFMPVSRVVLLFLVADFVSSYWLAVLFQVNHLGESINFPKMDPATKRVNIDWAELQIITALDYGHKSWFWTFASGALNYQVTHHLFPGVSQYHYPAIAPIVKKTCKEHGIAYNEKETVWQAIASHVSFLEKLGREPSDKKTL